MSESRSVDGPAPPQEERRHWVLPVVIVLFAMLAAYINQLAWYPVMPKMMEAWAVDNTGMTFYSGVLGIMTIIFAAPFGMLTTRIGFKWALVISLTLAGVGAVIIALSPNLGIATVGRCLAAAGFSTTQVPALAAMGLIAPKKVMAQTMAVLTIMGTTAVIIGQQAFGVWVGNAYGWQGTHWAMAIFAAAAILVVIAFLKVKVSAPAGRAAATAKEGAAKDPSPYRNPQVWMLTVGVKFAVMPGIACSVFVPLVLAQQFGMDSQGLASIAMIGSLVAVPVLLFIAWLSDKLKTRKWVALAVVAATLLLTFGLFTNNVTAFSVVVVAMSAIGSGPVNAVLNSAFPEVHPYRNVATAFGLSSAVGGLFTYLFAQALGVLADKTGGFDAGWIMLAIVMALAGLFISRLKVR